MAKKKTVTKTAVKKPVKKVTKKTTKRKVSYGMTPTRKDNAASVKKLGQFVQTRFLSGKTGISIMINGGPEMKLVTTLELVEQSEDGLYRVRMVCPSWILEGLDELGYKIVPDGRSKPKPRKRGTASPMPDLDGDQPTFRLVSE